VGSVATAPRRVAATVGRPLNFCPRAASQRPAGDNVGGVRCTRATGASSEEALQVEGDWEGGGDVVVRACVVGLATDSLLEVLHGTDLFGRCLVTHHQT
jgi:hypothetical protein